MSLKGAPIRRKLMTMILLTSGTVLLLTCAAFLAYEFLTFRQSAVQQLSTVGEIIAANSTAALAFDNQADAEEILAALQAERHIVAASLYDQDGKRFSIYPADLPPTAFPAAPEEDGYRFTRSHLTAFQPVLQRGERLGTLYLKSDMGAMYERFRLYSGTVVLVITGSFLVAYLLSQALQRQISRPILALAETAKAISEQRDYSVRATKHSQDELGLLTDAFNQMLRQIHVQDQALRESEARLREINQELERRVVERTGQLEAVNKELEAFCYSVSHDLRAPLRGIDGYSRLLLEDYANKLDEEGRTFIDNVRRGVQQMSILIDDLLAYSRMERRTLQNNPIDLKALVRSAIAECAEDIQARGAELRVDLPPLTARADPDGLTIVLRNLLENALKFTPEAAVPVIEIGGQAEGGVATVWVRDNGIGFDMKFHDRIFEIFQRLQRAEDYPGTGIGLAMARKAMQRMGGRIWAASRPGQGATFYLELPL